MLLTRLLSLLGQLAFGPRGTAQSYTVAGHDTRVVVLTKPGARVDLRAGWQDGKGRGVVVRSRVGSRVEVL